jgi:dsRNA-specific ribonuclease
LGRRWQVQFFQNKKKSLPVNNQLISVLEKFENILDYNFNDNEILLEALTHGNSTKTTNYQRLEVIEDTALGKFSKILILKNYPC